ncbi:family 43 glycosylhydrolase [Fulvitalea axinellae]
MKRHFLLTFFIATLSASGFCQNPIIKDIGMSDPHVRVFNDTIYLYSGHDASPEDKTWVMKDWRIFATTDLVNWTHKGTISPKDNYMADDSPDCWAGDASSRNGKYYFYFSDRKRGVGVMVANSPTGPFKDPLGKALVSPLHDPTLFVDDDENQTPYIVYGDKTDAFYIAKLNDDMISVAEQPKPIQINGESWKKAPYWMDKNYLFKHSDCYYLSWGRDYAVSKNVYGPYESVGAVGHGHNLNEYAHGSFFEWQGQFYHIWCHYLRRGYKYRECVISYCHIDDDGKIVTDTDFMDKHATYGVGRYNDSWDRIEAEWFTEISEGIKKRGTRKNGFVLTNIKNGSWIKFANVRFEKPIKIRASLTAINANGTLEFREGSPEGRLLGKFKIRSSHPNSPKLKQTWKKVKNGERDIYIKYSGTGEVELDWIGF